MTLPFPSQTPTLLLATGLLLGACGGPEAAPAPRSAAQEVGDRTPLDTMERSDDAPTVSGTIDCAPDGTWMIYAWRLASRAPLGSDGLPLQRPALATTRTGPGPWSLRIPVGPRRMVAAIHPETGTIAWSDPHGRAFPVSGDLEALSLTCLTPTPAPDGSTVVAQGEHPPPVVQDQSPAVDLADTPVGRARTSRIHRIAASRDIGGPATEQALRRRYAGTLDEDTTRAMMPLLVQLADSPDAADRLVADTRAQLGSARPTTAPQSAGPAPVGLIEMDGGYVHRSTAEGL